MFWSIVRFEIRHHLRNPLLYIIGGLMLMLAFGACHERAEETMYSRLRDYHDTKRKEAIAAWNLTFNTDPSVDDDADEQRTTTSVRVTRV